MTIETPANFRDVDPAPIPPPFDPTADAELFATGPDTQTLDLFAEPIEPADEAERLADLRRRMADANTEFCPPPFPLSVFGKSGATDAPWRKTPPAPPTPQVLKETTTDEPRTRRHHR